MRRNETRKVFKHDIDGNGRPRKALWRTKPLTSSVQHYLEKEWCPSQNRMEIVTSPSRLKKRRKLRSSLLGFGKTESDTRKARQMFILSISRYRRYSFKTGQAMSFLKVQHMSSFFKQSYDRCGRGNSGSMSPPRTTSPLWAIMGDTEYPDVPVHSINNTNVVQLILAHLASFSQDPFVEIEDLQGGTE